jgi:hypothetical protein
MAFSAKSSSYVFYPGALAVALKQEPQDFTSLFPPEAKEKFLIFPFTKNTKSKGFYIPDPQRAWRSNTKEFFNCNGDRRSTQDGLN